MLANAQEQIRTKADPRKSKYNSKRAKANLRKDKCNGSSGNYTGVLQREICKREFAKGNM